MRKKFRRMGLNPQTKIPGYVTVAIEISKASEDDASHSCVTPYCSTLLQQTMTMTFVEMYRTSRFVADSIPRNCRSNAR